MNACRATDRSEAANSSAPIAISQCPEAAEWPMASAHITPMATM